MDLSKLSIEPRLRNGWQAIDLGFAMARRWWWPCFLVWAIPSFIVYVILSVLLYSKPGLVLLLTWWLKPLWDRLPLFVASRALFGEMPGLWSTLRQLPRLVKPDLFASLSYRRFSLSRSFDLPVTLLEGLCKEARSRRLNLLHQRYGNAATSLTLVCVHVEAFIGIGVILTLLMLVPGELQAPGLAWLEEGSLAVEIACNFIMWMTMALVAPFYCLAGFSLYINRRIQLEGWDIEVRFRHLLARHKGAKKSGRIAVSVIPLLFSTLILLQSDRSVAAEALESPEFIEGYYQQLNGDAGATDSKQNILQVLSGEDFFHVEMERKWRFKDRDAKKNSPEDVGKLLQWLTKWEALSAPLRQALKSFAGFFEVGIWLLLAAALAYVVYKFRSGLLQLVHPGIRKPANKPAPDMMFGLDVREESLPDDVCQRVLQLWDNGADRAAMSLLYRATLSRLIHDFSFEFYAGFTEQECVEVVKQAGPDDLSQYLQQLTSLWQHLAYAHRRPQREQLTVLCTGWQALFEEGRRAA